MSKEKILSAYQNLAEHYNAEIDQKPHNAYYDRPNTLSLLPDDIKGKSILDAACGPGKYSEILIKYGATVTGFDLSPKMISFAKKRNPDQGEFFVHDLAQPLKQIAPATFDIILCALAMHYIQDWNRTIKEFYRLLKPYGQLILSIEHPFFEYLYFKSEKYFSVESVTCTWSGFGIPVEMYSYRRPLMNCILPLTENGFWIDKLIEPLPVDEFEDMDPEHFIELNNFPAFMMMRAIRKP